MRARMDKPPLWPAILCGGVSGLLAGITGIGGGLFVAATMLLLGRGADQTRRGGGANQQPLHRRGGVRGYLADASHPAAGSYRIWALAASLGGMLGVWLGSNYLPAKALRFMLAAILVAAGLRLALG